MGATLSTVILAGGVLLAGVLSAVVADYGRKKNWDKAKLYAAINATICIILVGVAIFLIVKSRSGASEITGAIESMAFGVMLSAIFLMVSVFIIGVMNVFAAIEATRKSKEKVEGLGAGASALSFVAFIISMVIVVFLL